MISAIEIKHFRGFERLKLDGLRAINIIVGPSAAGKTSLLEGLRLALGATPQVAFNLAHRGMPNPFIPNLTRDQFELFWTPLFFDFDVTIPIDLSAVDQDDRVARLAVSFDQSKALLASQPSLPLSGTSLRPSSGQSSIQPAIVPLAFKRTSFAREESTLYASVGSNGQIQLDPGNEFAIVADFLYPFWPANSQQITMMFSKLSIAGSTRGILDVLIEQFPEIMDISVESPSLFPALYASMRHVTRKMPLAMVSSGIYKFVSLLLAIASTSGDVLLIDEIENGIYYQTMPALWRALHTSAKQSSAQLFLTTHSWECLKSAAPLIEKFPGDFNLIQMYQEDGKSVAKVVPGEHAAAAIEAGIEVRA
ncbi:MAG: AAA family ATPase [Phycisphaerae bacterium]